MKSFLFFTSFLFVSSLLFAQARFAVVSGANNTTKIVSTFDSALTVAVDGDYIYMPGGTFPAATINKRVFIYGAGHRPDSTVATGTTIITGTLYITSAASGGLLEGCVVTAGITFGTSATDQGIQNFVLKPQIVNFQEEILLRL